MGTYTPEDPEINTYDLLASDQEAEATRDIPTVLDKDPRTPLNIDSTKLTVDQKAKLDKLLGDYDDIFAYTPDQLGRCSLVKHRIDTGDHPPIRLRFYHTSQTNRDEIDKQINEMLENDVISPSVSPWAASVVLGGPSGFQLLTYGLGIGKSKWMRDQKKRRRLSLIMGFMNLMYYHLDYVTVPPLSKGL